LGSDRRIVRQVFGQSDCSADFAAIDATRTRGFGKRNKQSQIVDPKVQPVRPDRRQDLPPQDVSYRMLDQQTLDGIAALVSELEVKKIELHSELGRR
jgi:hypothetical protein